MDIIIWLGALAFVFVVGFVTGAFYGFRKGVDDEHERRTVHYSNIR